MISHVFICFAVSYQYMYVLEKKVQNGKQCLKFGSTAIFNWSILEALVEAHSSQCCGLTLSHGLVLHIRTTSLHLSPWTEMSKKNYYDYDYGYNNWMAWCKRDVSDFFRWNFFSFKSAWIFACAFQLSRKTFSCIVFWLKCSCSALLHSLCTLQYFVLFFSETKCKPGKKNTGECCTT